MSRERLNLPQPASTPVAVVTGPHLAPPVPKEHETDVIA